MSLGQVALGLASLAMGVHQLRNGARRLSDAANGRSGLDAALPVWPTRGPCGTGSVGQIQAYLRRRDPAGYRRMQRQAYADVDRMIRQERGLGSGFFAQPTTHPSAPLGRAFMDSGRQMATTRSGNIPMRMRSFNIRTLDDRIKYLSKLVDEGKRDPAVYAFARRALTGKCPGGWCVPEKDNVAEARTLFGALRRQVPPNMTGRDVATSRKYFKNLRRNVRYTSDIYGVDTYQKPSHTLALRSGDCDDYSSLTCAGLSSIGIPCRFKVIRTKGASDWNHIFPQAGFPRAKPTRWISMDSSVNMPFGWEAPPRMVAASRVFRVG